MTVKEFTERTGYTPCDKEEWKAIEMMYLEAGESVDKDLFCKEWLAHKDSNLLRIFYKRAMSNSEALDYFKEKYDEMTKFLLDKNASLNDDDIYWQAVKIVGQKRVVEYKIAQEYPLNPHDKEYIKNNLH